MGYFAYYPVSLLKIGLVKEREFTMRFLDIFVERFGVLQDSNLSDLSRGMTVVYGSNGSGKTTMVNFLQGMLFGYTTDHQAFQAGDQHFGGSVSVESKGRSYRIARERKHGITTDLSSVDLSTGVPVTFTGVGLPVWVNESVYREVFSVGDQEAARFDLLSRLCFDGENRSSSADEIRRTEMAIEQSVVEREGNGLEGGLRQKMTSLQRRREELERQLIEMRRTSPEIPPRITELRRLESSLAAVEQQIREAEGRILKLEEMLIEIRRQNIVSIERSEIEAEISQLQDRQRRWQNIRDAISCELKALNVNESALTSRSSMKSIRGLVTRLEERMDTNRFGYQNNDLVNSGRSVFGDHLRSEVFSLCEYVGQHESAIESHEACLESMFGKRSLQETESVDALLQSQIQALRSELSRSGDLIKACDGTSHHCLSPAHEVHRRSTSVRTVSGSIEEYETELVRLRSQHNELRSERSRIDELIHKLQSEMNALRSQLKVSAGLDDIDRVKTEIAEIDAKLALLRERWSVMEQTERSLHEVIQRLNLQKTPAVLSMASKYITRLTDGDCFALECDRSGTQILARTRQSADAQTLKQLSRGTRDQVALSLRLALIQSRTEQERCPLILDDVFVSADDERAAAVTDLLMEVAADGQQIIFFTCQNDVRELFTRRNASILHLEERPVVAVAPIPAVAALPIALVNVPTPVPAPIKPVITKKTNWLFYLEVDNSIEDLSGLTVAEIEAFRATDMETIDDLLTISVEDLESLFLKSGYSISSDRIRAWRGQAELATKIPMLRRSDAELLYESGIQTTVELSRMRPETVFDVVMTFQNSQSGSRYRRSGRSIDRQQAINWSRWSQHSRSLTEARQARSRFFVRTSDSTNSPHSAPRSMDDRSSVLRQRRATISRGVPTTRRQRRPQLSSDASRQRDARLFNRRQRLAQHSSSYRTATSDASKADSPAELRFYLSRSSDVEAAPSIGEKTAQRLGQIGIYTVDDLLNANSSSVADRLNNRRITPETIEQWQAQARLVCQVPELCGHDAQILVACGVTEPEQLSHKRPVDLFSIVGPFADTTEGERIVRGGTKPDLEEVTDWIRLAQQARSLRSAA